MKLVSEGVPVKPLFQMIAANVRVPRMVIGDIHAILGAERLGAERLIEFLKDYRMDDLDDLAGTILERSEAAMAAAVDSLPDGTYSSVLDIDGHNRPVRIAVKVTIRGGQDPGRLHRVVRGAARRLHQLRHEHHGFRYVLPLQVQPASGTAQ